MKLNIKQVILLGFIIILIVLNLVIQSSLLKVIFAFLVIITIGYIVFFRNGQFSLRQSKIAYSDNYYDDNVKETEINTSVAHERIMTEDDLLFEKQTAKITPFVPSNLKDDYYIIANQPIPTSTNEDTRFNFILEKILEVIKIILPAYSVIFFWYNKRKGQVIVHTYASDSHEIQNIRYDLSDDVVSKVVMTNSPEFLSNINSNVEASLIRYYKNPIGIKSVVAVPIYYNEQLIGVLVADSKSDDSFGAETVYLLGRFVRLITLNLSVFDEKYNVSQINQKFDSIINLIAFNYKGINETILIQKLIVSFGNLLEWDVFAIVLYNSNYRQYLIQKVTNHSSLIYSGEGTQIDLEGTLVGKSIQTGNSIKIDDSSSSGYFVYKVNQTSSIQGSIIITPIISPNMVYGAFVFENLKKDFYTNEDVRLIEKIASFFSSQLDALYNLKLLNEYLSIDLDTMLLNKTNFEKRVQEELTKFKFTQMNVGFAYIVVDKANKLLQQFSDKISAKIAKHVTFYLNKYAEDLMLFGRVDKFKFGVLFLNKEDTDAYLWCEKIRQAINKDLLSYENQQVNLSVSIGYTGGKKHTNVETLFNDAEIALNKALSEGGNKVKSIK